MEQKNEAPSLKTLIEVSFVMVFSTVFTLLCGELVMRLAHHDLFSTRNLILRQLDTSPHEFDFDPELTYVPVKSSSYTSPPYGGGLPFKITTDENTLRVTPRPWGTPLDQRFRILTVGDSFTFCNEVSDDETWPTHLQEILKTTVVNGGVPMYGFDQVALRLEKVVDIAKPALVIVSITPQDLSRTVYSKQIRSITGQIVDKPYFALENDHLKLMNSPLQPPTEKVHIGWFRSVFGRSHLVNSLFRTFAVNWWLSVGKMNNAPEQYRTAFDPKQVSCLLLQRIDAFARAKHFVPLVLNQAYWQDHTAPYQPDDLTHQVYECGRKLGWPSVAVDEPLREVYDRSALEYDSLFLPWAHMTNRGNLLVAQKLATEISRLRRSARCEALAKEYGAELPCDPRGGRP